MCGASSSTSTPPPTRRSLPSRCSASARSTRSRTACAAARPKLAARGAPLRDGQLLEHRQVWLEATLPRISTKSELAVAIRYALKHWPQLTRYRDNGHLEIDNNAAERAIRPLATRRSLCSPSSSVCKHCKLGLRQVATRATCSLDRRSYPFMVEVGGSDLVRSARHNLLGGKGTVLDQLADAVARDTERR